ncbi:CbtA family protein [Rhizosaccharibacter radicis]|uniref:CbtA family protein n=1 Tax=Rhizosaccharibacter radicis TaxID=2782605 RepID=A0ABT1W0D7_9PROT|nr:CbtA family protein [Acetobacteraceae bacterium KSS12]
MAGRLLLRGMLVGAAAACLMVLFAEAFGEPAVGHAIAFESALDRAAGMAPEPELVSRAVQRGVGLLCACLLYGAAIGGLFSLVFAALLGRVGRIPPRVLAALLALGGFVALVLVPDLKYPPNPPAVGNPDTIGLRTAAYGEMMLVSLASLVLGVLAACAALRRFGAWNACAIGVLAWLVVASLSQAVLPAVQEVPANFPAVLLWQFRVASLGMQAVMWSVLGFGFGAAAETVIGTAQPAMRGGR